MKVNFVENGASRYVVGTLKRFNQRNEIFKRALWDPTILDLGNQFYSNNFKPRKKLGYSLKDISLLNASWYLDTHFTQSAKGGQGGLYDWKGQAPTTNTSESGLKKMVGEPQRLTIDIKRVANFLGASLIGVCALDRRWLYSYGYYPLREEPISKIEIPEEYNHAIVIAIEMDFKGISYSPTYPASATTGINYSKMAFIAGLMAQYIRGLGYKAIPCGNDTACSIPIAIDAGLGELSRNGLLIISRTAGATCVGAPSVSASSSTSPHRLWENGR
jgi:hypothetical protein